MTSLTLNASIRSGWSKTSGKEARTELQIRSRMENTNTSTIFTLFALFIHVLCIHLLSWQTLCYKRQCILCCMWQEPHINVHIWHTSNTRRKFVFVRYLHYTWWLCPVKGHQRVFACTSPRGVMWTDFQQ